MTQPLKKVLLLALPASGKSEVRRYLHNLTPTQSKEDFHMGPTVQIDDFPYVHIMRRVDEELEKSGQNRLYFGAEGDTFQDKRDWGTLIQLLNEDYADLVNKKSWALEHCAKAMMQRLSKAAEAVGIPPRLTTEQQEPILNALEPECRQLLEDKNTNIPDTLEGKTLVIEFARGGPDGSAMPLAEPHGYQYSLSQLSDDILHDASILYIWVTPEESRRKNEARTDPNDPGSILHHGVPLKVMLDEYGCDDIDWLEQASTKPGTIELKVREKCFYLPIARFDNRVDKTSFIRDEPADWKPEDVNLIHTGLKNALDHLSQSQAN